VSGVAGSPEILLVIPTLGQRPHFLEQTIESIRRQDLPATVVLVGPDARDSLIEVAHRYSIPLVPDPGSLPAAINLGVQDYLGEHSYVGWLNDDDFLEPGSLSATVSALEANPEAVVAYGACRYVDNDGQELWISRAGRWATRVLSWGPDLIPQPGMLVRAWAWEAVGGLDESYGLAFDLDLLLRLRKRGELVDCDQVVSNFRWHADSLTVDNRDVNFRESERAKRAALGPLPRKVAPVWEPPVRWATRLAVWEVNRRARRLVSEKS